MSLSKKDYLFIAILILLILFLLDTCQKNKILKDDTVALLEYKTDASHYKDKLTGLEVAYNESLDLNKASLKTIESKDKVVASLTKKLKEVKSITNIVNVLQIDSFSTVLQGNPCDSFATFRVDTTHYSAWGRVMMNKIYFDGLGLVDSQSIVIGKPRQKFFKAKEYRVLTTHSNPYITVTNIEAYTFKNTIPVWKKKETWLIAGFVLGLVINK